MVGSSKILMSVEIMSMSRDIKFKKKNIISGERKVGVR